MWSELSAGRIVAVVGAEIAAAPPEWRVVRVRCGGPRRLLAPLLQAVQQVDAQVGTAAAWSVGRRRGGARDGLLGESAEPGVGAVVVALNRLAGDAPSAVILERIDRCDPATLSVLQQITARPGWLQPALVVSLPSQPAGEDLAALLSRAEQKVADAGQRPVVIGPMPAEARRIIRAAAVIGAGFELSLLAELLSLDPLVVLAGLQDAHDAGVRLDDLGGGRFQMDARAAEALTAELLPSLSRAWHTRLAALIHPPEERAPVMPPLGDTVDVEPEGELSVRRGPDVVDVEVVVVEPTVQTEPPADSGRARAAAHLSAAGDTAAAVGEYLVAAEEVAPIAARSAVTWAEAARDLAAAALPERADLRCRIFATLGRLKLSAAHCGYSLDATLADLDVAAALVDRTTPAALRAGIDIDRAAALSERGDVASRKAALGALSDAMTCLEAAGDAIGAARLLNDQAAVWAAVGDPARAGALLRQSWRVFARLDHPDADAERAETEHLLARLVLHSPPRSSRLEAALKRALQHASDARHTQERLGNLREVARLDETTGRLRLAQGEGAGAREALQSAIDTQRRIGDLSGLARSMDGMAEVLLGAGRADEALAMLEESIRLNISRGAVAGLQANRAAFEALAGAEGAGRVAALLAEGEAMLGSTGPVGVQ